MRTRTLVAATALSALYACTATGLVLGGPDRESPPASSSVGGASHPDFNGDGFADLAIGAPHARAGRKAAGEVHVVYGSAASLDPKARQVWGQNSKGLRAKAEYGDQFGWSVASGDFDGDGFTDLAIGSRFEDRGARDAGVVHVLYGTADGLRTKRSQRWSQGSPGIADKPERGDQFGWSMAAGDFDGDGRDDLAIGAHHEDRDGVDDGVVHVLYGHRKGLRAKGSQYWSQDSPGIAETPEPFDQFGRTLAVADFDGDGRDDLAIGAPYEGRFHDRVGVVHVLHGSGKGLTARKAQIWHQDTPGIAEQAEKRDQFGQSLAAADFDGDGFGDLAVGVWFEDYRNALSNEGGFHVIYGSKRGLRANDDAFWHQDKPGTRDRTHVSDRFGQVLTAADFDGDGRDDLVVGIPSTDLGEGVHDNRGAVHLFRGSKRGLGATRDQYFSQRTNGVLGKAERNDHFGEALASADFDGDGFADLAVGIPFEDRAARDDGAVYVVHGSARGLRLARDLLFGLTRKGLSQRPMKDAHFGWAMAGQHSNSGVPRTADPEI